MELFRHQRLDDLAEAIQRVLSEFDINFSAGAIDQFDSATVRPLWKRICEVMLDYCCYRLAPASDASVDPFDDPYVGALLMTESGRVLAAHRKETRNEPHAEAITLLDALAAVPGTAARDLNAAIQDSYAKKEWLHSRERQEAFVEQFVKAGRLVRAFISQESLGARLVLISTLEPCRDFESQPGCAHLIAAFRPDLVLYASDDTNTKGQGGPLLCKAEIPLLANIAVEKNIAINLLFYSSVHCIDRLLRQSAHSHDAFALRYMVVQLNRIKPIVRLRQAAVQVAARIHIEFDDSHLPVYQAPLETRAPRPHLDDIQFDSQTVDANRVLFINQFHTDFLLTYYQEHVVCTGRLPGVLVCCGGIEHAEPAPDGDTELLITKLRLAGVRVYTNVLRKVDEHFLAQQAIARWRSPVRAREFLYVLAKTDSGYRAVYGTAERIKEQLLAFSGTRRINVYLEVHSINALQWLFRTLKTRGVFDSNATLIATSFGVILLSEDQDSVAHAAIETRAFLQEQDLSSRVTVETQQLGDVDRHSAGELREQLIAGAMDPIYIGGDTLGRLLRGDSWKDREAAGLLLDAAARRDPLLYEELILKKLPSTIDVSDWQKTCSVLNALAKFGRPPAEDVQMMLEHVRRLGAALATALSWGKTSPVFIDLVWRFMSAVHSIVDTVNELEKLLGFESLELYIASSPFLLKELLFYANRSSLAPTEAIRALQRALGILERHLPHLSDRDRISVLLRINRLATLWNLPGSPECKARVREITSKWPEAATDCLQESERCRRIIEEGLTGIFSGSLENRTKSFASYLFLRTTKSALAADDFRGLLTELQAQFRSFLSRRFHPGEKVLSWRGDKTSLAKLVLSEIPRDELLDYLRTIANDEDDTIRWAALVLAMDFGYRRLLLAGDRSKLAALELRSQTAMVIRLALSRYHYWLHREFLELLLREHAPSNPLPTEARLQLTDLGNLREFIFSSVTVDTHPEVASELRRVHDRVRRVALILPPLDDHVPPTIAHAPGCGSPPLGLGSIGSYLLSRGHDVEILDCHRYPALIRDLADRVRDREFVGFSVVASTFVSTRRLVWTLRTALGTACPIIVIGGHGPTLQTRDFVDDLTFQWDYLVLGDGEVPFGRIVESHGHEPIRGTRGIVARRESSGVIAHHIIQTPTEWDRLPWVDRRLFVSPAGVPYEPVHTRNGTHIEAHVVMSRSCDWHCSFCTEAILRGPSGEARRSVDDVIDEVRFLVRGCSVDRVHFIDDNLLPQIGAGSRDKAFSLAWSRQFLESLAAIRRDSQSKGHTFGWRALFRLEDFIQYREVLPDWYELLVESGCLLLSFGIESGSQERRKRLKGSALTNEDITAIVSNLTTHSILSKGYFMIGGINESENTAWDTIRFAVTSGLSLAYFALYKNFRGLIEASRRNQEDMVTRESTFMKFGTLRDDLSAILDGCRNGDDARAMFGNGIDQHRLDEARLAVDALKQMEFSFRDLFKYNDFHENLDLESDILQVWSAPDVKDSFIRTVRRAYFEFYARREFVAIYRSLIERGY